MLSLSKEIFTFKERSLFKITVYNQIKSIREKRNIKQNEMAEALDVSRQTMTAIEKMKYNPSLELSLKIADYFNLSVEEIFTLKIEGAKKNEYIRDN